MKQILMRFVEKLKNGKHVKRSLVTVLAAVVVFTATYALVLPAITLDEQTAEAEPGIELSQTEEAAPAETISEEVPAAAEDAAAAALADPAAVTDGAESASSVSDVPEAVVPAAEPTDEGTQAVSSSSVSEEDKTSADKPAAED